MYLMDWPWVTPQDLHCAWNPRIRAHLEKEHHLKQTIMTSDSILVNLRGCIRKKKDAGDVQPSLNGRYFLHDVKSNLGPKFRKTPINSQI